MWLASKIDDSGLWLKSLETSGRVLYPRIFECWLASFISALTSSALASFFRCTVRSTSDTLITGTRTDMPVNLPASSGSTRPTASAAPVLLGIMFWVAERARYGST
ncbi:hypothetical protein D3C84_1086430 [compost metagenome]